MTRGVFGNRVFSFLRSGANDSEEKHRKIFTMSTGIPDSPVLTRLLGPVPSSAGQEVTLDHRSAGQVPGVQTGWAGGALDRSPGSRQAGSTVGGGGEGEGTGGRGRKVKFVLTESFVLNPGLSKRCL